MALPKITLDRIENEAELYANKYLNGKVNTREFSLIEEVYTVAATAEATNAESIRLQLEAQDANVEILLQQKKDLNERSQKLVEALELVKSKMNWIENADAIDIIRNALQQWNAGNPDRPCPHCGKELSRDRNLCCRECGKEVEG